MALRDGETGLVRAALPEARSAHPTCRLNILTGVLVLTPGGSKRIWQHFAARAAGHDRRALVSSNA
jgi:hypothetical protein